jgi:hypothetical protein
VALWKMVNDRKSLTSNHREKVLIHCAVYGSIACEFEVNDETNKCDRTVYWPH